jgi:hypothetical protein
MSDRKNIEEFSNMLIIASMALIFGLLLDLEINN